jgi:uncharacterized protein YceH (UPF0502 family)
VEGFLQELAARPEGALVVQLARLPGARESRWAHLLSGEPKGEAQAVEAKAREERSPEENATLGAKVERLEGEVAELKALVERIRAELNSR